MKGERETIQTILDPWLPSARIRSLSCRCKRSRPLKQSNQHRVCLADLFDVRRTEGRRQQTLQEDRSELSIGLDERPRVTNDRAALPTGKHEGHWTLIPFVRPSLSCLLALRWMQQNDHQRSNIRHQRSEVRDQRSFVVCLRLRCTPPVVASRLSPGLRSTPWQSAMPASRRGRRSSCFNALRQAKGVVPQG